MRVAFLRNEIVEALIEIDADQIEAFCDAYGCDSYLVAPLDDPALRAVGEGAKLPGAASKTIAGSRALDGAKITITPAASVPAGELAAALAEREAAIEARAGKLTADTLAAK